MVRHIMRPCNSASYFPGGAEEGAAMVSQDHTTAPCSTLEGASAAARSSYRHLLLHAEF
jgi:hypothetical protein